jgi:predicted RNA binding protein YcfA (HicA-like mRNA interferase family)
MKLPRNISGADLAQAMNKLGYSVTRQTGSHMRLTTQQQGEHHVTIPCHDPLQVDTLAAILAEVAAHFGLSREELADRLWQ